MVRFCILRKLASKITQTQPSTVKPTYRKFRRHFGLRVAEAQSRCASSIWGVEEAVSNGFSNSGETETFNY